MIEFLLFLILIAILLISPVGRNILGLGLVVSIFGVVLLVILGLLILAGVGIYYLWPIALIIFIIWAIAAKSKKPNTKNSETLNNKETKKPEVIVDAKVITEKPDKPNGLKILFVDDDKDWLWILKQSFKEKGWEVSVLTDAGDDFVGKVSKVKPDLISLDIQMPKRDGLSAIKLLKASNATKNIPVIFLNNLGDKEHIEEAIANGADDYIINSIVKIEQLESAYTQFLTNRKDYAKRYPACLEIAEGNFYYNNKDAKKVDAEIEKILKKHKII